MPGHGAGQIGTTAEMTGDHFAQDVATIQGMVKEAALEEGSRPQTRPGSVHAASDTSPYCKPGCCMAMIRAAGSVFRGSAAKLGHRQN